MIERDIVSEIEPWIGEEKIILITGARQVGKTTLLLFFKERLLREGKRTAYFSADQELSNPNFHDAKLFVRFLDDQFLKGASGKVSIFIDEFQYIPQAGLFLKQVFDMRKDKAQFFVSGSSSLEIAKNSEYLTGRKISFRLRPFSFREYLSARSSLKYEFSWTTKEPLSVLEEFVRAYGHDLKTHFLEYLTWGGYPEAVTTEDAAKRSALLKEIVSTYIQKDVAGFLRVENTSGFNNLAALLAGQIGNMVNKHELANTLNLNAKTIDKYLDILEGTFVFTLVRPFHSNIRKTISKTPKVYAEDFGIVRTVLREEASYSAELMPGNRVENFIWSELACRHAEESIFFYRTQAGAEVDFVVQSAEASLSIEVKWQNGTKNPPRVIQEVREEVGGSAGDALLVTRDDIGRASNGTFLVPAHVFPFITYGRQI